MLRNKISLRILAASAGFSLVLSPLSVATAGTIIYSINAGTNFGTNGAGSGPSPTFTDNMDGTFTLSHDPASGGTNAVYINSGPDNINALAAASSLGRTLLSTDTVIVRGVIDSSDVDLDNNGIELGVQSGGGFRSNPNLLLQVDHGGNRGGRPPFFSTDGPGANVKPPDTPGAEEASLLDGFSFIATYDASGMTWEILDIVPTNVELTDTVTATSYSFSYTDSGYDLLDDVATGFAYFSTQKLSGFSTVFSEFSIEIVAAVPEPSSLALLGYVVMGLVGRRRGC